MVCSECKSSYHYECSSLKEISWKTMGPRRNKWKCKKCKKPRKGEKGNGNMSNAEDDEESEEEDFGDETEGEEEKKKEQALWDKALEKVRDPMAKQLILLFDKRFNKFEMTMAKIMKDSDKKQSKKLSEFEVSLNYYGDQMEEAVKTVKALDQKIVLLEKRIDKSDAENKELRTRLRNVETQMNELAQKDYNNKVEISGIKDKNCNPHVVVSTILEKAGYQPGQIQFKAEMNTKAVGENRNEKSVILVSFPSQGDRNKILTKIKKEKVYTKLGTTVNTDSSNIFINEALCPYYKKILFEAGKLKRDKNYTYLWVKDGRILLKKTEGANTMKLQCLEDLGKL